MSLRLHTQPTRTRPGPLSGPGLFASWTPCRGLYSEDEELDDALERESVR